MDTTNQIFAIGIIPPLANSVEPYVLKNMYHAGPDAKMAPPIRISVSVLFVNLIEPVWLKLFEPSWVKIIASEYIADTRRSVTTSHNTRSN